MHIAKKTLLALSLLAAGAGAQAATITFSPTSLTANVGSTFSINLVGTDFTEGEGGTYGGGVSLSWDPTILSLQSYDTSVFGGDKLLAESNTTTVIDNISGQLRNLSVASSFTPVISTSFNIAVLTFNVLNAGNTQLNSSLGQFDSGFDNIWTDSSYASAIQINPEFEAAAITAVPVPAAVWLMGSALMAGAGFVRRKQA